MFMDFLKQSSLITYKSGDYYENVKRGRLIEIKIISYKDMMCGRAEQ